MRNISICTVTRGEPHSRNFLEKISRFAVDNDFEFVVGADGNTGLSKAKVLADTIVVMNSKGYLESILNTIFSHCSNKYVFRLDDDELMSPALEEWLISNPVLVDCAYSFPRCNLWGTETEYLPQIYPDKQIRLINKEIVTWPTGIHEIPSCGYGTTINKAIMHHKFIIKDSIQRHEIANSYEEIRPGAGFGNTYKVFTLPEEVIQTGLRRNITELGDVVYGNS